MRRRRTTRTADVCVIVERPDHFIGRRQIGGIGDAHQHHFSRRERAAGGGDLGNAFEQHLPGAREHAHGELLGKGASARTLDFDQRRVVGDRGHDLHAGHEMGELGEMSQHHRGIGADVVLRAQLGKRGGDIASHQRLEQVDNPRAVGKPQHLPHVLGAHWSGRVRDGLIQQRQRVTHRAFGCAHNQRKRLGLDLDGFPARNRFEMLHQQTGIDPTQIETLAARKNGDGNLADFRGGEDELGVRRRLFQGLEQGVEGLRGEHVNFVENVDLVAGADRSIANRVVDLAHVVDAVVRGGVHLDDVDVPALHDRLAMHADRWHFDCRRGDGAIGKLVVERTGEDARRRGLADAAHAGEDPGLRDASSLERIRDRAHHRILADQIIEGRGTILASEHAVGRIGRRPIVEDESRLGLVRGVAHNAIRSAARRGSSRFT